MQLQEILYSQGFGTRRVCCGLIQQGHVAVGNPAQLCTDATADFEPDGLEFTIQGKAWHLHVHDFLLLLFPTGLVCSQ